MVVVVVEEEDAGMNGRPILDMDDVWNRFVDGGTITTYEWHSW